MSYQLTKIRNIIKDNKHPDKMLRKALRSLDQNQAERLLGDIYGELYWSKRKPDWFKDNRKYFAIISRVHRWASRYLAHNLLAPELNANGLIVHRSHAYSMESFEAPMESGRAPGWVCENDGAYHSFWSNEDRLMFRSYTEGDVITLKATTKAQWQLELEDQLRWYRDNQ